MDADPTPRPGQFVPALTRLPVPDENLTMVDKSEQGEYLVETFDALPVGQFHFPGEGQDIFQGNRKSLISRILGQRKPPHRPHAANSKQIGGQHPIRNHLPQPTEDEIGIPEMGRLISPDI